MAEPSFVKVRGRLLDHLRWLSRWADDPRVRQHMDAIEVVVRMAGQLRMAREVEADLRQRLEAVEGQTAGAERVGPMLSYCRGHGCQHYLALCRLGDRR